MKILKPGNLTFHKMCPVCGCEFEYNKTDVYSNSVHCPCCNEVLIHNKIEIISTSALPDGVYIKLLDDKTIGDVNKLEKFTS